MTMECITNNFPPPVEVVPCIPHPLLTGKETHSKSTNISQVNPIALHTRNIWRVEDLVGLELTLVPEVECVFVEKEDDRSFIVYTVVNERDLEVRSRIYDRELAILDANPGIGIEFNILSRRNRPLEALMGGGNVKPYKRNSCAKQ